MKFLSDLGSKNNCTALNSLSAFYLMDTVNSGTDETFLFGLAANQFGPNLWLTLKQGIGLTF